jgi:hypothetical protein
MLYLLMLVLLSYNYYYYLVHTNFPYLIVISKIHHILESTINVLSSDNLVLVDGMVTLIYENFLVTS